MQETRVQSLGGEDPLEMEMANCSCILARKTPWTVEPGRLEFMDSQRIGRDSVTEHAHGVASLRVDLAFRRNLYRFLKGFLCMPPSLCSVLQNPWCSAAWTPVSVCWGLPDCCAPLRFSLLSAGRRAVRGLTSLDFTGIPVLLCLLSQCLKAVVSYILPGLMVTHGRKVSSILDIHSQKAAEVTHLCGCSLKVLPPSSLICSLFWHWWRFGFGR